MRICLDVQAALAQRAGIGRYVRSLAEHLLALPGEHEVVLFHFDFRHAYGAGPLAGAPRRVCRWCPHRLARSAWRRLRWPPFEIFAGSADLFHFPNFVRPPVRRARSVVTIHDLSFLRFPEAAEPRNRRYLEATVRETVRRADAIVTVSEFVAGEVRDLLGVPAGSVFPVPLGVEERFRDPGAAAVGATLARLGVRRPYLLHVGTLEPRKNAAFLAEVLERMGSFGGELVLAGPSGWNVRRLLERLAASPVRGRIRRLHYVSEEDLPALYAGAELFVFPSLSEGFGLPPLEAMACGTPVLAAATGSLPEVLGEAAELVRGFDAAEWAARAGRILSSGRAGELRAAGRERAARFRWEETARATLEVYRRVLGG